MLQNGWTWHEKLVFSLISEKRISSLLKSFMHQNFAGWHVWIRRAWELRTWYFVTHAMDLQLLSVLYSSPTPEEKQVDLPPIVEAHFGFL